ncbi:MAG TPA: glutamate 5-kinase [Syntrophomonadaceae bacterium]|nr:glutamate 5-kinase [Syntrophomonadaceae bacterium]
MLGCERAQVKEARRIVVKVGTKIICGSSGQLDLRRMESLVQDLSAIWKEGLEVILVSSGAIGAGVGRLGLSSKPRTIPEKQAAAAVGQGILMQHYETFFTPHRIVAAQVLLTREDITNRERYLNARHTLQSLLDFRVVPIVNENDTVAVEEIRFGDNDNLAALVACLVDADLLILLTDLDGYYTSDPNKNKDAKLIPEIYEITPEIEAAAGGRGSALATGGMETKIMAAKVSMQAGIPMVIASGMKKGTLPAVIKGKQIGTLFVPREDRMQARKLWIAFGSPLQGRVVVDQGAANALLKKGKSLLPTGIVRVEGSFTSGNAISIVDTTGQEIARGISNYTAQALQLIKGHNSGQIKEILGYHDYDEVVHRDNLTIVFNNGT